MACAQSIPAATKLPGSVSGLSRAQNGRCVITYLGLRRISVSTNEDNLEVVALMLQCAVHLGKDRRERSAGRAPMG